MIQSEKGCEFSSPSYSHLHFYDTKEVKEVKPSSNTPSIQPQQRVPCVKFDLTNESNIFLDNMFKNALKYSIKQQKTSPKPLSNRRKASLSALNQVSVGIDIQCYGSYHAKMAFVTLNSQNGKKNAEPNNRETEMKSIEMVYDHIG